MDEPQRITPYPANALQELNHWACDLTNGRVQFQNVQAEGDHLLTWNTILVGQLQPTEWANSISISEEPQRLAHMLLVAYKEYEV